jgi:hypothetical protein
MEPLTIVGFSAVYLSCGVLYARRVYGKERAQIIDRLARRGYGYPIAGFDRNYVDEALGKAAWFGLVWPLVIILSGTADFLKHVITGSKITSQYEKDMENKKHIRRIAELENEMEIARNMGAHTLAELFAQHNSRPDHSGREY